MKRIRYRKILIVTCLLMVTFAECSIAQVEAVNTSQKTDPAKLGFKNMVDSQHFIFVAQTVTPLRGRFRNLTSEYDVIVAKDSLVSYLPYFGRAYTAPLDPSQGGLDFTSTHFSYSVAPHKKDGWEVTIKPKDNTDVQQLLFIIFDNGTASLTVTSTSKDPISFNGYLQKERKKKKNK